MTRYDVRVIEFTHIWNLEIYLMRIHVWNSKCYKGVLQDKLALFICMFGVTSSHYSTNLAFLYVITMRYVRAMLSIAAYHSGASLGGICPHMRRWCVS